MCSAPSSRSVSTSRRWWGFSDGANTADVPLTALRRVLMTADMGAISALQQELQSRREDRRDTSRPAMVMHVDLDNIDDPDPAQVERNLALLLQRIRAMGVNTVLIEPGQASRFLAEHQRSCSRSMVFCVCPPPQLRCRSSMAAAA